MSGADRAPVWQRCHPFRPVDSLSLAVGWPGITPAELGVQDFPDLKGGLPCAFTRAEPGGWSVTTGGRCRLMRADTLEIITSDWRLFTLTATAHGVALLGLLHAAADAAELRAHRPSAFAWIRCPGGRFVAVTRRNGSELNAPGGKRDRTPSGELEPALDAAVRETREETGIELDPARAVRVCEIGYASMYLWDMTADPVLAEPEPGIHVAIVDASALVRSQYWRLFNGPTLEWIRHKYPRPGDQWSFRPEG